MRRRLPLVLLLALAGAACRREHPCQFVARDYDSLPILSPVPKEGTVELRVLYLEDPRVPTLDAKGRAALYARAERLAKRWLGYTVKLREVGARDLRAEFAKPEAPFHGPREQACLEAVSFDPATSAGEKVVSGLIAREFDLRGPQVFSRLFPDTLGMPPDRARSAALLRFMALHKALYSVRTRDGPLLAGPQEAEMYSFNHWIMYLRGLREADFVITNVAWLVPDNDMPVYVLARGGLTTGVVDNSPQSRYKAVGAVTLLPFLSGETLLDPGAAPTTEAENLDAAATMWAHELGHFLNRFGEMYGESGCVHVASEGLKYFQWHRAIVKADNACSRRPPTVSKY